MSLLLRDHLLGLLVFLPAAGALWLATFPKGTHSGARGFAMGLAVADLALACAACARFVPAGGLQLQERATWAAAGGFAYALGVDGVAMALILCAALLLPPALWAVSAPGAPRPRAALAGVLILHTCCLGALSACDLFLFACFWQAMVWPASLLIQGWDARADAHRRRAAWHFGCRGAASGALMTAAVAMVAHTSAAAAAPTLDWPIQAVRLAGGELGGQGVAAFAAIALACALQIPLFPLHRGVCSLYALAPGPEAVWVGTVVPLVATLALWRYGLGLFPAAATACLPVLSTLACCGAAYGGLMALAPDAAPTTDHGRRGALHRAVGYSMLCQLGLVALGMMATTVASATGSVVLLVSHVIAQSAVLSGMGRDDGPHPAAEIGVPAGWGPYALLTLMLVGVPGSGSFVGQLLVLMGTFRSEGLAVATTTGGVAHLLAACAAVAVACVLAIGWSGAKTSRPRRGVLEIAGLGMVLAVLAARRDGLWLGPLAPVQTSEEPFHEIFAALAVVAALGVAASGVAGVRRAACGLVAPNLAHRPWPRAQSLYGVAPMALMSLALGLYPQPLVNLVAPTVARQVAAFRARAGLPRQPISPLQRQSDGAGDADDADDDGGASDFPAAATPAAGA